MSEAYEQQFQMSPDLRNTPLLPGANPTESTRTALLAQFGGDDAGVECIEMDTGCGRSPVSRTPAA
jgi:hypothetical protein